MAEVQDRILNLGRLASSLGFALRISQLSVFARFYDELGVHDMKPGEFSILYLIDRNPDTQQGEIAKQLFIKRAHMTKLVRSFDARGLLTRRVPDNNRRAVLLRLTDKGRSFVAEHAEAFFTYHTKGQPTRLSPDETAQLIRLLQKFSGLETPS